MFLRFWIACFSGRHVFPVQNSDNSSQQSLRGFFQPWNGMVACDQPKRKVAVTFKARQITVLVNGEVYLRRATHKEIVPDESTWHIDSEAGILEVCVFYVAMDIFCVEESGRVGRSAMGGCAKA